MSKCIITGCRLVIPVEGRSLWGDLHQLHDGTWVFNGALKSGPNAYWGYGPDAECSDEKQLIVTGPYFEKRGVVVIPATSGEYNQLAKEYLK